MSGRFAGVVAAVALSCPAQGETGANDHVPDNAGPRLEFRVTPGLWLVRATGDASLGSGAPTLDLDTTLDLRSQESTFVLDVDVVLNDKWLFHVDGFDFDTAGGGTFSSTAQWGDVSLSPGDDFRSTFEFSSITGEVGYAFLKPYKDNHRGGIQFSAIGGVRLLKLEQSLTEPGVASSSGDGTWFGPYAGLQFDLWYKPDPGTLPFQRAYGWANVGFGPAFGGDGGTFWHVRTGLSFDVNEHFALLFGFRLAGADVEDGDYQFNGSLQGMFLAFTVQF